MSAKWSEFFIKPPSGSPYENPEEMAKVGLLLLEATGNQAYFLEHRTGFPRPTACGEFEVLAHGDKAQKEVESFFKQYSGFSVMGPVPHDDDARVVTRIETWGDDLLKEGIM
jgi:hypothetical protein